MHLPESRDAKRTSILLSLLLRPTSRWKYCDFTARDSKKPTRNAASVPNCVNAARVNCKIPAEPSTDQLTKCCVSLEARESEQPKRSVVYAASKGDRVSQN